MDDVTLGFGEHSCTYAGEAKLPLSAAWPTAKPSENNRRAKFYSLSRLGRKQLQKEAANWERLSSAITGVVRLEEA